MNAQEAIRHLLDWYPAVRDGVNTGNGGDGDGWRHMHYWWHEGSFPQLEQYLGEMRRYRLDETYAGYPVFELRTHIDWWFLDAVHKAVPAVRPVKRNGKTVGFVETGLFERKLVRDSRADEARATAGVAYLADRFNRDGLVPRLPVELFRIVTGAPEKAA